MSIGPGYELGGFRILRKLGSGGMGEVFLADQLSLGRFVAVKILHPKLTRNKSTVERFMREVKIVARFDHPTIVTAIKAGHEGSHYYFAMSYVEGKSLKQILKEDGPFSERYALEIVETVAEALGFVWRKHQILHRDIKPENIMIDNDGSVRLLDLGIAKSFKDREKLTLTGAFLGTPDYSSPEQAAHPSEVDCRSDIYALGTTLYHLLAGVPPYREKHLVELLMMHRRGDIPCVQEHNPDVSNECSRLVAWMMAKRPEDRPGGWREFINTVKSLREAKTTRPVPNLPKLSRHRKYFHRLLLLIPAFVILLAIPVLLKKKARTPDDRDTRPTDSPIPAEIQPQERVQAFAPEIPPQEDSQANRLSEKPEENGPKPETEKVARGLQTTDFAVPEQIPVPGDSPGAPRTSTPGGSEPEPEAGESPRPPQETEIRGDAEQSPEPDSVPGPTPPVESKISVRERILELQNQLEISPGSFSQIMRELNELKVSAANQSEKNAVKLATAELLTRRKEVADEVFLDLDRRTTGLFEDGDSEQAVAVLREYEGPAREETAIRRQVRANEIEQQAEALRVERANRVRAKGELIGLLEKILLELFRGAPVSHAARTLKTARDDPRFLPVIDEIEKATETVLHLAARDKLVLDSFQEDIDAERPVFLKRGQEKLSVIRTEGAQIHALKQEKYGKIKIILSVNDLSTGEILQRLPAEETPENNFLRGVTALRRGLKTTGMKHLSKLQGPMGQAFENLHRENEGPTE